MSPTKILGADRLRVGLDLALGKDSGSVVIVDGAGNHHVGIDLADAMRRMPTEAQREIASFTARAERIEVEDMAIEARLKSDHETSAFAELLAMASLAGIGGSFAPPRQEYVGPMGTRRNQHAPPQSEGRVMSPKTQRRKAKLAAMAKDSK